MSSLSREVSQVIVSELLAAYPPEKVSGILEIGPARLKAVVAGRARLAFDGLDRIRVATSKSWRQWLVTGTERLTGVHDPLNKATRKLVDELDDAEAESMRRVARKRSHRRVAARA